MTKVSFKNDPNYIPPEVRSAKELELLEPEELGIDETAWTGKHSKSWFITINNYTDEDIKFTQDLDANLIVIGKEIGPVCKTPHVHMLITFKVGCRFAAMKKLYQKGLILIPKHLEMCKAYCMKDRDYTIQDKRTPQGTRSDLIKATCCTSIKQIREEFPDTYVKFHSGLEKLISSRNQIPRDFKPEVYWYYGPTNTGKSRTVNEKEKGKLWTAPKDLSYFLCYENQEAVLFDDFREERLKLDELLTLIDRYEHIVPVKYGDRQFNSKRIYFTSPFHPSTLYKSTSEDINQLLRRIDTIIDFGKKTHQRNSTRCVPKTIISFIKNDKTTSTVLK